MSFIRRDVERLTNINQLLPHFKCKCQISRIKKMIVTPLKLNKIIIINSLQNNCSPFSSHFDTVGIVEKSLGASDDRHVVR